MSQKGANWERAKWQNGNVANLERGKMEKGAK